MTLDEQDLRAGMRALAGTVPPAPPGRAEASVRRSVRMRRTRVVASVAMAVALAGPVVYVATGPPAREAIPAGTPISEWPDDFVGLPRRSLAELAYADYVTYSREDVAGLRPRYLYANDVPNSPVTVVAFALCRDGECPKAAIMFALQSEAFAGDGDPSVSSWVMLTRKVVDGVPEAPLAVYVEAHQQDPTAPPRNIVVVVGPPETRRVTWQAGARGPRGTLEWVVGAFAGDVGYLNGHATVTLTDELGRVVGTGRVGGENNTPNPSPSPSEE